MIITIPSRSRHHKIGLLLAQMPQDYLDRVIVFAPESQQDAYERALRRFTGIRLMSVPNEHKMADVRDHMGRAAIEIDDTFLMIDDDVRFEMRRGPDTTRTVGCKPDDVRDCLDRIASRLEDGRWGQVGLTGRMMQNQNPLCDKDGIRENTRNACVTGWRARDFLSVDYRRCVVRSDFDATLQLLRKGRPNCNLIYWQHSQVNNVDGGCADYRTTEIANEAALRLQELHPGLVKVVEKKYEAQARRSKNNMGVRLEVVIQWQRALGYDLREPTG